MKLEKYQTILIAPLILAAALLTACNSDIEDPVNSTAGTTSGTDGTSSAGTTDTASGGTGANTDNGTTAGASTTAGVGTTAGAGTSDGTNVPNASDYILSIQNQTIALAEGAKTSITVEVQRSNGHQQPVNLAIEDQSSGRTKIVGQFSDTQITSDENSTSIELSLDFSALPIQAHTRTLRITGTDGRLQRSDDLTVEVQPTTLPDVYLLIGQSNMVGFSEIDAKQAEPGQEDARDNRIMQLNVTGNDQENFRFESSFTDVNAIAASPRLTVAVDPLHDGYDTRIEGKPGTRIGLGIRFAKSAIENTSASTIYLVPAAWANTGFCARERELFPGDLGWNASDNDNPALSGKLLHDRAIARTNLALQDTNGILRGILWHQGEADSENMECAQLYKQNLIDMVKSLRTNINPDARGPSARGPNANIPFVVGTMSRGGDYFELSAEKRIVDTVHREIHPAVPFSAVVNNDDLVPTNDYPCGEGDCIHFGARSYREMGSRYYNRLVEAATKP